MGNPKGFIRTTIRLESDRRLFVTGIAEPHPGVVVVQITKDGKDASVSWLRLFRNVRRDASAGLSERGYRKILKLLATRK